MPCHHIKFPDGSHALVRTAAPRARKCSDCGVKVRDYKLCDWPIPHSGKTCDAVICTRCATHIEPDTDFCKLHAAAREGRLKL